MKIALIAAGVCLLAWAPAFANEDECCEGKMMMEGAHEGIHSKMQEEKTGLKEKFFEKTRFILMNASELDLDEAKIEEIKTLKHNLKKSLIMRDAEIETIDIDIMDAMSKDNLDLEVVDKLIDRKYEAKKMNAKEIAEACMNLRMMLTQDQQNKLKELMYKCPMGKMKMMMEKEHPLAGQMMKNQPMKTQPAPTQPAPRRMMMNP